MLVADGLTIFGHLAEIAAYMLRRDVYGPAPGEDADEDEEDDDEDDGAEDDEPDVPLEVDYEPEEVTFFPGDVVALRSDGFVPAEGVPMPVTMTVEFEAGGEVFVYYSTFGGEIRNTALPVQVLELVAAANLDDDASADDEGDDGKGRILN